MANIKEKQKIVLIGAEPISKKVIASLLNENYEVIEIMEPEETITLLETLHRRPQPIFTNDLDNLTLEQIERSGEVRTDFSNPRGVRRLLHRRKK